MIGLRVWVDNQSSVNRIDICGEYENQQGV